jgi:hypothetical protein
MGYVAHLQHSTGVFRSRCAQRQDRCQECADNRRNIHLFSSLMFPEIVSHNTAQYNQQYNAQLARCILKDLSPQESTEIIQLIKYPPTLLNLSHSLEGCDPIFSSKTTAPPSLKRNGSFALPIKTYSHCFSADTLIISMLQPITS